MKLKVLVGVFFGLAILLAGLLIFAVVYIDKHKVEKKPAEYAYNIDQNVVADVPEETTIEDDEINEDIQQTSIHKIDYRADFQYDPRYFSRVFLEDVNLNASSEDAPIVLALIQRYCDLLNENSRQLRYVDSNSQGTITIYTVDAMGQILRIYVLHGDELTAYITEV